MTEPTRNINITFNGKTMRLNDWADKTGITRYAIHYRIKSGWSAKDALTIPSSPGRKFRKSKSADLPTQKTCVMCGDIKAIDRFRKTKYGHGNGCLSCLSGRVQATATRKAKDGNSMGCTTRQTVIDIDKQWKTDMGDLRYDTDDHVDRAPHKHAPVDIGGF